MKKELTTIALAILASSSAYADWQYTKWGTTSAQVLNASKGKASKLEDEEKAAHTDVSKNSILEPLLKAPYSVGRFNFIAYFYFDKRTGGLSYVNLSLQNPDVSGELHGSLLQKYGKPVTENENKIRTSAIWHKNGDQITFYALIGPTVNLSYQALRTMDNTGL